MKKRTGEAAIATALLFPLAACGTTEAPATATVTATPSKTPEATPTPSTPATTPAAVACNEVVKFTSPANGTTVNGKEGVTLTFDVCGLNGRDGWLLEKTTGDTASDYTVVGDGEAPLSVEGQGITVVDKPVGDEGVRNQNVNIYAVVGGTDCSDQLRNAVENNGNQIAHIPAACQTLGQLTVHVTN